MTQRTMKITDFENFRYPTNLAMSPDGKFGVFAVVQPNIEGNSYVPHTGNILDNAFAFHENTRIYYRQGGIFHTADFNVAKKRIAAANNDFFHI